MPQYNDFDILKLCERIEDKKLEAPLEFKGATVAELKKICNGVGGNGTWLAYVLTLIYWLYQASAAVHDFDYHYGIVSRLEADRRFRRNMIKEWELHYGWSRWFRPMPLKERAKIEAAYLTVRKKGAEFYSSKGQQEVPK